MTSALWESALTKGGLDRHLALDSMPTADRCWIEVFRRSPDQVRTVPSGDPATTHVVGVHRASGWPRVFPVDVVPPGYNLTAHLEASPRARAKHTRLCAERTERERDGVHLARRWLAELSSEELIRRLDHLLTTMSHAGPVIVFIEDEVFTNVYDPVNLTGGTLRPGSPRCRLSALVGVPPQEWASVIVRLFYALTHVADAGPTRLLKELNFQQLGYWQVRRHLAGRHHYWSSPRTDAPAPPGGEEGGRPGNSIDAAGPEDDCSTGDLVAAFRSARARTMARPDAFVYRAVHGRAFAKVERWFPHETRPSEGGPYARVADAAPAERSALAVRLLREALDAGMSETASEYVMSRGVRDYRAFVELCEQEEFEQLMSWEPSQYFCFVRERRRSPDGSAALQSISERMKYNTWHFIPDTLKPFGAEPPPGRDYFFAPSGADIGVHEDRVHAGHVRAQIRYAMRFPRQVTVLGRRLNGLADVRFARKTEPAYRDEDMVTGLRIAEDIAQIHQALADFRLTIPADEANYERYLG